MTEQAAFGNDVQVLGRMLCKHVERVAFTKAVFVSFPSEGAQRSFHDASELREYEYRRGPVLYNTVLTPTEHVEPNELRTLGEFERASGLKVASIGGLTALKGIDLACRELAELALSAASPINYFVVGDGPLRHEMYAKCAIAGKRLRLFWLPKMSNAGCRRVLRAAKCYFMLHRLSVFDLATLEAMDEGCAVILSRTGGNLEYNVSDNIVFHGDENWRNAICAEEARRMLGKRNAFAFAQYFSPSRFRNRYDEVHKLLDQGA